MLGLSELLLAEPLSESQKSLAAQILRSGDVLLEMIGQVLVSYPILLHVTTVANLPHFDRSGHGQG
jgi:hypothetical protein